MAIHDDISDRTLMEKLQKGDVVAFDQVFKKYAGRLFCFAYKYLKSKEETEELVQDVFLKIWENHKNLKTDTSLKSYLFTIVYHKICGIFRKRQLQLKFMEHLGAKTFNVDLEKQFEFKATLEHVENCIEKLPGKQRTIFLKSRKEGKSTHEIAKEMNLAPGTVDNHISAALKFLRKHIPQENLY